MSNKPTQTSADDGAIRQAKDSAHKQLEDFRLKQRVEAAAIAIFAAMQANPNWNGSLNNQWDAIQAARALIGQIDGVFSGDHS